MYRRCVNTRSGGEAPPFARSRLFVLSLNFILAGHDGPFHLAIASGRPLLRGLSLYHGKHGAGVGVETQVKHGPVTLLSLTQTRAGNLKLVAAQGESIPGPVLQIGNTDSHLQFI